MHIYLVKEASLERPYTIWLQQYEIPQKAKLQDSKKINGFQQLRERKWGMSRWNLGHF